MATMRLLLACACMVAGTASAEPKTIPGIEAPFATGVAVTGGHAYTTIGGHLAMFEDTAHFHIGGGAEWTLILDYPRTMPQAWLTVAPELRTERGDAAIYLGPSLRGYDLYGLHATLAAELGARVLLLRSISPRRKATVGLAVRASAPVVGRVWTATVCLAVGPLL